MENSLISFNTNNTIKREFFFKYQIESQQPIFSMIFR